MNKLSSALALACALTSGACATKEAATAIAAATITDSAGVQIVVNHAPLWTDATRWRIDSLPVTVVGADENDPHQHFKFLEGITRRSNGDVLIMAESELRWFDSTGKYIKSTTRRGSGPGEFTSPASMVRLANDTVLVLQSVAEGGMKIVTFNPDGSLLREDRPDANRFAQLGHWNECRAALFANRSMVGCQQDARIPVTTMNRANKLVGNGYTSPGPGHLRQLHRLYVIPASLNVAHALGVEAGIEQFGVDIAGHIGFYSHPFYSSSILAAGGTPFRIAQILNPAYDIQIWTPTGTLERIIRRVNARRAPTADEIRAVPDMVRERYAGSGNSLAQSVDIALAQIPTPDSLPAAQSASIAETGELIVQREGLLKVQSISLFDVFDTNGTWLGELRLPARSRIVEVSHDRILTTRHDEDDRTLVEVYRLHRPQ